MKAYILSTVVVTFINFINERLFFNSKNKNIKWFLFFLSLTILCFVAGARNVTVGTDINVYVTRLVSFANKQSNLAYFLLNSKSDFLFSLVVYLGNLTKSMSFVLFLIQLAGTLPIFIYAYLEKERKSFTISIFIFLMTMYASSFNIMRQSIAISICILAYHFWDTRKHKSAILLVIAALLFHKTAFIFFIVFLIHWIVKGNIKNKELLLFITILSIILVPLFLDRIVGMTLYSDYLTRESLQRDFSLGPIVKKVFWLIISIFCYLRLKNYEDKNNLLISTILIIISLVLTFTSFTIPGTGRLGYYFNNLFYFTLIPDIPKIFKQKYFIAISLAVILAFFWWNMTAVENDSSRVYPYKSDLIKVLN